MILLETTRLRLRRFRADDLEALAIVLGDAEVMRYSVTGPQPLEMVQSKTLPSYLASYESPHRLGRWVIERKADHQFLGFTGLGRHVIDDVDEFEIGYRLGRAYWGQGFATEAVHALCGHAFEVLHFQRLIAIIDPGNVRSHRVAEKCGFFYEKDSAFYGRMVRIYAMLAGRHLLKLSDDPEIA